MTTYYFIDDDEKQLKKSRDYKMLDKDEKM
jgi:hypothetical protein